jgi:hypothetical protein
MPEKTTKVILTRPTFFRKEVKEAGELLDMTGIELIQCHGKYELYKEPEKKPQTRTATPRKLRTREKK